MSTRSILALQKGNKIRYCSVHWDGDLLGQELRYMTDAEIEDLYSKLAPLDDGHGLRLSFLENQAGWEARLARSWAEYQKSYPDDTRRDFEAIYMDPQPTAHDPIKSEYYLCECATHIVLKASPDRWEDIVANDSMYCGVEWIWHYNLETRMMTWFNYYDWAKKHQKLRRRRRKPKTFK